MSNISVNIIEAPVMIIMSWSNISRDLTINVCFITIWNINFSYLLSTLKECLDTIIMFQKVSYPESIRINLFIILINPMILSSIITLNCKNIS